MCSGDGADVCSALPQMCYLHRFLESGGNIFRWQNAFGFNSGWASGLWKCANWSAQADEKVYEGSPSAAPCFLSLQHASCNLPIISEALRAALKCADLKAHSLKIIFLPAFREAKRTCELHVPSVIAPV